MAAIRSASKLAAGRPRLRRIAGKKTALTQTDSGAGDALDDDGEGARAPEPGPAAEAAVPPVILWDDPVGSEGDSDRKT
jgi:hypothetical protein